MFHIYCGWFRNPAPVDRWKKSHYLLGFNHPFGGAGFRNHPHLSWFTAGYSSLVDARHRASQITRLLSSCAGQKWTEGGEESTKLD